MRERRFLVMPEFRNATLRRLTTQQLSHFEPWFDRRLYLAGERIAEKDQPIDEVHFVESGVVLVSKDLGDRDHNAPAVWIPNGDFVLGGRQLFQNRMRPNQVHAHDFTALTDVEVVTMPAKVLLDTARKDRKFKTLCSALTKMLDDGLGQTAGCHAAHTTLQKFCRFLLMAHDAARSERVDISIPVFARMLGKDQSTLNRAVKRLGNAILIHPHRITVCDRAAVEDHACVCYRKTADVRARIFAQF